jgi:hypothetical protein
LKFSSNRLRDCNYKIDNINLDIGRQNQEIVRIGNSELIRAIQRIRGIDYQQSEVDELLKKKKKRKLSYSISEKLDKILYIEDIVTIEFDDSRHYKTIINKGGIFINGKKYVRLLAGAGMTRRSTSMFVNEEIAEDLRKFLNCGRDPSYKISPAKFNAYYALAASSTLQVSTPNFVVIPDCEIDRLIKVDFLIESDDKSKDPIIEKREIISKTNLFDGQGIISPEMSEVWKNEIDADYLPSEFIFRGGFLKGLLVTFDFKELAHQQNITTIKDAYGDVHNIENIDVIISTSQLKMWQAYKNTKDYRTKCEENNFSWGVSRCNSRNDKNFTLSTYQYLQNLNITNDQQIEGLCKKTVDWISNVLGTDWETGWPSLLFFLLGDVDKNRIGEEWFYELDNPLLQALLMEPKLINDKQVQQRVQRLINKKIKESYLGMLLLDANYQMMVSDPYAQTEWGLGLQIEGLLKESQHYSHYWNEKNKNVVSAIRSPMTYYSENNLLNLQNNEKLNYWYKYLTTGIVFNVFGTDAMRMSGSDFDGDICMTTDQKEFIDCAYSDILPPTYDRKNAEKKIILEEELWDYDVKTFKSKIGLITNIGTQLFAMLPLFKKDSEEYNEILNRLKICNCFQSMEIDRAKGIQTMDIPRYWTKWEKIDGNESPKELKIKELHHRTIADKRPYFFRYLYPNYDKQYKEHQYIFNEHSETDFGKHFEDLCKQKEFTEEENDLIKKFFKYNVLLDSECVMNKVCHYMEKQISEIKEIKKSQGYDFKKIVGDTSDFKEKYKVVIENIFQKYRTFKVSINYHCNSSGFKEMMVWLNKQTKDIFTSSEEIVYWASEFGSSFLLDVFYDDLFEVLKNRYNSEVSINIPIVDANGYLDYKGSKYEIVSFKI